MAIGALAHTDWKATMPHPHSVSHWAMQGMREGRAEGLQRARGKAQHA